MGIVLIVLDGLGGRPSTASTALERARAEFLDKIATIGAVGRHLPVGFGHPPSSEEGHLALFGYEPLTDNPGRGLIEALGLGIKPKKNAVYFRGNFATFANDGLTVVDRRAGRNDFGKEGIVKALEEAWNRNPWGFKVRVWHLLSHRFLVEVEGLETPFGDTDPKREGRQALIKDEFAEFFHKAAFEVLKKLEINEVRKERGLLPINGVLLRGGAKGDAKIRIKFNDFWGFGKSFGFASAPLYLGVARYVGIKAEKVEDDIKVKKAIEKLEEGADFVFLHFKKTDIFGHDGKLAEKAGEIEKISSLLEPLSHYLEDNVLIVTGDHATPWQLKRHSSDPVPFLIAGGKAPRDGAKKLTELDAARGYFGIVKASKLIKIARDSLE